MKYRFTFLFLLAALLLSSASCTGVDTAQKTVDSTLSPHPELTEQEKLIACADCHRDITPDLYQEWFDSRHGLDKVKCFLCHGTYEDFRIEPDQSRCAACHNRQFNSCGKDGEKCWSCHAAHSFKTHRK